MPRVKQLLSICGLFLFFPVLCVASLALPSENPALTHFLKSMPKGGNLHVHLTGASYAEHLLDYAKSDLFCVNDKLELTYRIDKDCSPYQSVQDALAHPLFQRAAINAWSMAGTDATKDVRQAHDHFFETFGKIAALTERYPEKLLAEILSRSAAQHVLYLEVIVTFDDMLHEKLAIDATQFESEKSPQKSLAFLEKTPTLHQQIGKSALWLKTLLNKTKHELHCDKALDLPVCHVVVRFLVSPHRMIPENLVFTELYMAFELAKHAPDTVAGVNFVGPEDHPISMQDNLLQMQFFKFFHDHYPAVNISLHAGELSKALLPATGKENHIARAINIAGASRIGHGVDILSEKNPTALLKQMADQHILVEINLTSNEKILNIKNNRLPFLFYLNHNVPLALSTDDAGVLRTTLTQEYALAVERYHLNYATLKEIDRNSLSYSFLPGESLWTNHESGHTVPACKGERLGALNPRRTCRKFLAQNQKARMQWTLEHLFHVFEHEKG